MSNETEIRNRFWKELKNERTIMLGIDGEPGGGMQPMTALVEEEDGGPLWIFTSKETDLARALVGGGQAAHDPKLTLLRFDAEHAKIWLNATPLGAAIEWLLRHDPKETYKDKVAEVAL